MTIQPFEIADPGIQATLVTIWNAACGAPLAITPRFASYNTQPVPILNQRGCLAVLNGQVQGFVLASVGIDNPVLRSGWIDALAVLPDQHGQGVGGRLLQWAEDWLQSQGCSHARLGGSLNPWVAGLPLALATEPFFARRGYTGNVHVWDVAHRLSTWQRHAPARDQGATVSPLVAGREHELLDFLHDAFPGRWEWECEEFFRIGGRRSDCLVVRTALGVEGFCRVTFEDSLRPIERFYPHGLPQPWGQLGPIGVRTTARGKGYGALLLDEGLAYLRARGIDGCIIDWTTLLDLYSKWGFRPYHEYAVLGKDL